MLLMPWWFRRILSKTQPDQTSNQIQTNATYRICSHNAATSIQLLTNEGITNKVHGGEYVSNAVNWFTLEVRFSPHVVMALIKVWQSFHIHSLVCYSLAICLHAAIMSRLELCPTDAKLSATHRLTCSSLNVVELFLLLHEMLIPIH